jgi:hypothetical protein
MARMWRRDFIKAWAIAICEMRHTGWAARPTRSAVQRWQPHDFIFECTDVSSNPFEISFSADVSGPNGVHWTTPGFYDGDCTWKIRLTPSAEGAWSVATRSDHTALDKRHGSLLCVSNKTARAHGAVLIDAEHASRFVYEDGTHFFPMGYECDWLWALDSGDPDLPTVNAFLDKISSYGFNFILLNAFAYDTSWCKGRTGEDDYGPPPLFAWEGTNEQPDHSRFNLAYWRHYDRVLEALRRRGIWAHIFLRVYNKYVNWPANDSADDDLYYRWLLARYAAYPNVTWDLAKEAQYEKDMEYKVGRLRYIRANDPYHRLMTVHDDHANYDRGAYNDLVDYRSDQQHSDWREVMLTHLRQQAWPVINMEFGYECGPKGLDDKTYIKAQLPEEVCRRAWEVYMAGGFGAYYYTYTAWDVIRPTDTPPGYEYFKNLHQFFATTRYWRMKPLEGITSEGYCLGEHGKEYVIFLNLGAPFRLALEGLTHPLSGEWYQPFSGARQSAGKIGNGDSELMPPAEWRSGPVALHLVNV